MSLFLQNLRISWFDYEKIRKMRIRASAGNIGSYVAAMPYEFYDLLLVNYPPFLMGGFPQINTPLRLRSGCSRALMPPIPPSSKRKSFDRWYFPLAIIFYRYS